MFADTIRQALPEYPIAPLQETDALLHVFYDLQMDTRIPGCRHLYWTPTGERGVYMPGETARWLGIRDRDGRLMVAINFDMDMGDAWQHADDPYYPQPMTALAYKFGVNYVIYTLTR